MIGKPLFRNTLGFCGVFLWLTCCHFESRAEEPLRRTILAAWDSSSGSDLQKVTVRIFLESALNHIGFNVRYVDVAGLDVRAQPLDQDVEGVVAYFPPGSCARSADPTLELLARSVSEGRRVLLLGAPPFRSACPRATLPSRQISRILDALGLGLTESEAAPLSGWIYESDEKVVGAASVEPEPYLALLPVLRVRAPTARVVVSARRKDRKLPLAVVNGRGAVVLGEIAFGRYTGSGALYERRAWFVDPFLFLGAVFGGDARPVPDRAVGFGRRLLIVNAHVADPAAAPAGGNALRSAYTAIEALAAEHPSTIFSVTSEGGSFVSTKAPNVVSAGCPECVTVIRSASRYDRLHPSPAWLEPLLPAADEGREDAPDAVLFPFADEVDYVGRNPAAPFAFGALLESFEMTGGRRILRPLAVRFGADVLAIEARRLAISKVLSAPSLAPNCPVGVAEWAAGVKAGARASISSCGASCWNLSSSKGLFSVRVPDSAGSSIDWSRSRGVLGLRALAGAVYVSLDPQHDTHTVALSSAPASRPELIESSVPISVSSRSEDSVSFKSSSSLGGEVVWRVPWEGCSSLSVAGEAPVELRPDPGAAGGEVRISLPGGSRSGEAVLRRTGCGV